MKMFEQHTSYAGRYDQSDVLVARKVGGGTVHGVGGGGEEEAGLPARGVGGGGGDGGGEINPTASSV